MILMQIMRADARMYPEIVEKRFCRSDILPKEYFDTDEPQTYIIFPIHASIGFSELKGRNTHDIIACMQTADEAMYIHKRSYKAEER